MLLAELDGDLLAAVSLDDLHAVADPFKPTSELVFLLIERARQIRRSGAARRAGSALFRPEARVA